jgi:hypothetical protein
MLQAGSGFCGACGRPVAQQQQWQQPPQPQQWQQPPQQQQWQQQQPWQQPPQQQPWQQPPQQQWQQPPQQPPQPQWQQPAASLKPFPLIMQQRLTRLTGHMFVAPTRLYFICESQKGGLAMAIGQGVGGLIGGAIAGFFTPTPGQAAPVIDENMLLQAAHEKPGSVVMEPAQIKAIKETWMWRAIWWNGQTYALPKGLSKELNSELAMWCQANNVKNAGLKVRAPAPPQ